MIETISCKGYRGFVNKQELNLAVPNGQLGSGLTVLIGPNGGGKSTLVECFSKLVSNDISFTEGKRNKLAGDRVFIEIIKDGEPCSLSTVQNGGSETEWKGSKEKPIIYYLPSRRVFNPYFNKNTWDRNQFIHNPENSQFRGSQSSYFTNRLFNALNHLEDFNKLFWTILGKKLEWTIDQNDGGKYYVKIKKNDTTFHNSDGLGEGIVSLLFIVDALYDSNPGELIVIDEPELSLHPQLQIRLLKSLLDFSKDRQIVISTHSPYMLSIESTINGGVIARIHDEADGSKINTIDDQCRGYFKSYLNNLNNPHTIGNDARACFFAEDGFIITEGQEDVVLFPKIVEQVGLENNIPFFGFGAGGASNIHQIAYVLKILGFKNIGAIFDGDKKEDYEKFRNEYEVYGFRAWIIPADDIRDKEAINKESKEGILDNKRNIKPEFIEEMKKILTEITEFSKYHL